MTELVDAYASARQRVAGFVRDLDAAQLEQRVPACPAWRVRDVIAHMTGIAADFQDGRFPTGDMNAWTAEQVAARAERPFGDVVDEWDERAPGLEQLLSGPMAMVASNLVADVVTHEFDVHNAIGACDLRKPPEFDAAFATFARMQAAAIEAAGLPPVNLRPGGRRLREDSTGTIVAGDDYELLRAISGRRTAEEIRRLDWSDDAEPYIPAFAPYALPQTSLGE